MTDIVQLQEKGKGKYLKTHAMAVDGLYPIGSIYMSINSSNPSSLFGGTWERIKGRVLVGVDEDDPDFKTPEKTGGEKSHKLSAEEMAHNHNQTHNFTSTYADGNGYQYTIGSSIASQKIKTAGIADTTSQGHNNLQPYITVYMWKRVG